MEDERKNWTNAQLLEYLFRRYQDGMYRVAFAILHDVYQAEDAVGDAYENIVPYLQKCKEMEEYQIKMLLTRFVKNRAIDIYRKNKRERVNVSIDEQEWLHDAYHPMEAHMKQLQYQELIGKIRSSLPANDWNVICMRYFVGMPVREITENLNIKEDAVYSRLRRAKEKAKSLIFRCFDVVLNCSACDKN